MNSTAISNNDFMRKMFDDSSPRPSPRFPVVPTPMNMERPVPTVPDVSLIFSSPAQSLQSANSSVNGNNISPLSSQPHLLSRPNFSPLSCIDELESPEQSLTVKLIKYLLDLTKAQSGVIDQMNEQIQILSQNQEKQYEEIMTAIMARNTLETVRSKADAEVQTDRLEVTPERNNSHEVPNGDEFEAYSSGEEDGSSPIEIPRISSFPPTSESPMNLNSSPCCTKSATDTTLYGFPSKYLSFATKDYLRRHGLINADSPPRRPSNNRRDNTNNPFFQDTRSGNNNGSNRGASNERILDITALKNQPKLI